VPVNTAPWASVNTDKQLAELQVRLASDPEWHGGRYYGKAACKTVLTEIRVDTLKRYGIETALAPRFPDPAAREAAIREQVPADQRGCLVESADLAFEQSQVMQRVENEVLTLVGAVR
jgi:hypothetical protein